ncbi:MAG: superoxide dismutase family protein [Clostridia bacterium]|nr:superoxide dismutase family protein [Clostridia bacterium]
MYSDYFRFSFFSGLGRRKPAAWAYIQGSNAYPSIRGTVKFYETPGGVLVCTDVEGLPTSDAHCESPIFAFHIHNGTSCEQKPKEDSAAPTEGEGESGTATAEDAFPKSGTHDNPYGCLHPYHAGDLAPLFGVNGNAFSIFLTGRFAVRDIIGKTVIIHEKPDDFHTQPSGNSGAKIACGVIVH